MTQPISSAPTYEWIDGQLEFFSPQSQESLTSTEWWASAFSNDPVIKTNKKRKLESPNREVFNKKEEQQIKLIQNLWEKLIPLAEQLSREDLTSIHKHANIPATSLSLERIINYIEDIKFKNIPNLTVSFSKAIKINQTHTKESLLKFWDKLQNLIKSVSIEELLNGPLCGRVTMILDLDDLVDYTTRLHHKKIAVEIKRFILIQLYLSSLSPYRRNSLKEKLQNCPIGFNNFYKKFQTLIASFFSRQRQIGLDNEKIIQSAFEYLLKYYNNIPFVICSIKEKPYIIIGKNDLIAEINKLYINSLDRQAYIVNPETAPVSVEKMETHLKISQLTHDLYVTKEKFDSKKHLVDFLYGSRIFTKSEFFALLENPKQETELLQKVFPFLPTSPRDIEQPSKDLIEQLSKTVVNNSRNQGIVDRFKKQLNYILLYKGK